MKTTYIFDYKNVKEIKIQPIEYKIFIDYYLSRTSMVRWDKEANTFTSFNGLIDIISNQQIKTILSIENAHKIITKKNIKYLIRRKLIGEYFFKEANMWGKLYRIECEDIQNEKKIIDEYHLVFHEKILIKPPFRFNNLFYGNIFDYLEEIQLKQVYDD